jgi:hypothetical protein
LFLSFFEFTQISAPPSGGPASPVQSKKPPGQPQTPPLQTLPAAHALPHPPQFAVSFCVLVHTGGSPQASVLSGHLQMPDWQVVPPVQATPHTPQLLGSLCGSMQAPEQFVSAPQLLVQPLVRQTWLVPQAV